MKKKPATNEVTSEASSTSEIFKYPCRYLKKINLTIHNSGKLLHGYLAAQKFQCGI
jgi:hypothetical protein